MRFAIRRRAKKIGSRAYQVPEVDRCKTQSLVICDVESMSIDCGRRDMAMRERKQASLSILEDEIRSTLAAVAEVDCWYDLERGNLDLYPEAIRSDVAAQIERRHRINRQPYVLHLAHLHQRIVAAWMYADPAEPEHTRRDGQGSFSTLPHSNHRDLNAPHRTAQSQPAAAPEGRGLHMSRAPNRSCGNQQ